MHFKELIKYRKEKKKKEETLMGFTVSSYFVFFSISDLLEI